MIKVFDTLSDYESYVSGGLIAGELYWVEEDKSVHFRTNNIDGTDKVYDIGVGDDLVPEGNIAITENSEEIDVAEYATASVNVPIPAGYIVPTGSKSITANGESIDVAEYATANVNVPIPAGYIVPTGDKSITSNGSNIDVAQYETVSVSVPASAVVSGTKQITSNGSNIDVVDYAAVDVNVPIPAGYIQPSGTKPISANGTSIDVANYAAVDVNVPIPSGYIVPTGSLPISINDTYDITNYASVVVNVPTSGGGPITGTVQADANGVAYIPCAEDEVLYYESSVMINAPYMFTDSNKQLLPIDGYGAPCILMKESDGYGQAKSVLVYVQDGFESGYDFSSVAYAMLNTTANATITYKRVSM